MTQKQFGNVTIMKPFLFFLLELLFSKDVAEKLQISPVEDCSLLAATL